MKVVTLQKYCVGLGLVLACSLSGCDQGLQPEPPPSYGISGTVTFRNWPHPDSVKGLAIVAFRNYPSGNLVDLVVDPHKARFSSVAAPHGISSVSYELSFSPSPFGWYRYVAVAQQYGPNILRDWRVAGLYVVQGDTTMKPDSIFVPANEILRGIDILVDFSNPPPQP